MTACHLMQSTVWYHGSKPGISYRYRTFSFAAIPSLVNNEHIFLIWLNIEFFNQWMVLVPLCAPRLCICLVF